MSEYLGAVEAGGTKFNCAIFDKNAEIIKDIRIPTTYPEQTLTRCMEFFSECAESGLSISKLGLACFGPLDLNPMSSSFGFITKTPKPNWSHIPIKQLFEEALNCQVVIDTDVNAAALAEYKWGASIGTSVSLYVTVGTGIGVGVVVNGVTLKGLIHPEAGHMLVPVNHDITGICPFHTNCVEGLASGKALSEIWGMDAEQLREGHEAWDIQADIMSIFCHNLLHLFSPEKIVFGGGVMAKDGLLEMVKCKVDELNADYLTPHNKLPISSVLCKQTLCEKSGLYGALSLLEI